MEEGRKGLSDDVRQAIEENIDLWVGSAAAFARELNSIYPDRSLSSWNTAIWRYKKFYSIEDRPEQPVEEGGEDYVFEQAYFYSPEKDCYITFLRTAGQNIMVPGDTHREMKEAYSNMVGDAASMNQIARRFNIPRNWFDEYKRIHGWTHDMDPFTDEEVLERDPEELVNDMLLRNRRILHQKFENQKWASIEKDAAKYRELEYILLDDFRKMVAQQKQAQPTRLIINESKAPYALVVSATDFHWGKYGWEDETGEGYSFEEAKLRLLEKTEELIMRLPGRPEKIILATGSDWFHIDNDLGQTTKGTQQDMAGSPAQILMSGCELAKEHIELLRQVAPVEVFFMAGNHDRHSTLALMMYLSASFENTEDVTVEVCPKIRQYTQYGNTIVGFTHGDTKALKNLHEIMAVECRELWGQTEHRVWFHGHFHHRKSEERSGSIIIQLPSLAGEDRYHHRHGYVGNQAGLAAHFIDYEKGLIGSLFAPV